MADLVVVLEPTANLVPYAGNARLHSDAQVAQIAASINEFGFNVPVLVDAKGSIVAGHGRVLAAQRLGMDHVPVIRLGHLTPAQVRAYRLADNQIALNSTWDESVLAAELRALAGDDFNLSLLGFDDSALQQLLAGTTTGATREADDDAPEPPAHPVTLPGDTWLLGDHRIRCGSSTSADDVAALLAGAKPLLMVTDPPYGVNYDPGWRKRVGINNSERMGVVHNDDRADWREAWELFPGDVAYVWHGGLHAGVVQESLVVAGFDIRAQIIWAKESLVMGRGAYHWQHEPCWYAVRKGGKGHWAGDRKQTTLWSIPTRGDATADAATIHSTQKPVLCMQRPIENNSQRGDAVYEPFSGSGTTIIAGEITGRRVLAMELSSAYVDVAVRRWQEFTGLLATLEGNGGTLDEVAAARGVPAAA
jgi:DNA modification methylase